LVPAAKKAIADEDSEDDAPLKKAKMPAQKRNIINELISAATTAPSIQIKEQLNAQSVQVSTIFLMPPPSVKVHRELTGMVVLGAVQPKRSKRSRMEKVEMRKKQDYE
jgi:hypothetical protein